MRSTYSNTVSAPEHVSTGTIGRRSYLVIARLVRPDGDEVWAPVRVVRWTAEAVMICLESDQDQAPEYLWLPVGDVRRTITVPTTLTTTTAGGDSR